MSLNEKILYYKVLISRMKEKNPALDPLNLIKNLPRQSLADINYFNEPHIAQQAEPLEELPLSEPLPTPTPFMLDDYVDYQYGKDNAVHKAKWDITGSFQNFYLPHLLAKQSYENKDLRRSYEGIDLYENSDDDYVVYYNRLHNNYWIAFRGTKPTNLSHLHADLNITFTSLNQEDEIRKMMNEDLMKKVDDFMERNKDKRFNFTGHSLGGMRASHYAERYKDQADRVVTFNLGQSPSPYLGLKPLHNVNHLNYHIHLDPLSIPRGTYHKINNIIMKMKGRPSVTNPFRNHGLDNFILSKGGDGIQSLAEKYIDGFKDNKENLLHTNEFYRLTRPENIVEYVSELKPTELAERLVHLNMNGLTNIVEKLNKQRYTNEIKPEINKKLQIAKEAGMNEEEMKEVAREYLMQELIKEADKKRGRQIGKKLKTGLAELGKYLFVQGTQAITG